MLLVARSLPRLCECNRLQNVHVKYDMIETYQPYFTGYIENRLSVLKHIC